MTCCRTYKCGHCGLTLPDSSEFHRHSALSHGDKIPDLVKDPEVPTQDTRTIRLTNPKQKCLHVENYLFLICRVHIIPWFTKAEAEYVALKGLLEWGIMQQLEEKKKQTMVR